jgi:recombination protein RecT
MEQEKQEKKATGLQLFNQTITSPAWQKYLEDILKERKGSFVNNVTALVANDVNLQECMPATIVFAALKATALDLPLDKNLGYAFVIPYKDNKRGVSVATFQLGYKGYKQLGLRSGQFKIIPHATEVKEGELVSRNRLTGECVFNFIEDDAKRASLPTIGYVSYFRLLNGAESMFYMSKEEVKKHALTYSQTYKSKFDNVKQNSKWTTDFDMMAIKTVTKLNLSNNAPLSPEMKDAIRADMSVQFEADKYEYPDNDKELQAQLADAQKAQEVADKFKDFGDAPDSNEQKAKK